MTTTTNPSVPDRDPTPRHVVLLGLMASGKTTVGTALARRLGRPFVDNDTELTARTGQTAREIANTEGPEVLHRREAEALVAALARRVPAVVAAAAAAPLDPDAAAVIRRNDVVYLRALAAVLAARLARVPAQDDHRPFVADDPRPLLDAQFAARDPVYRTMATIVVEAGGTDPEAIVEAIVARLQ